MKQTKTLLALSGRTFSKPDFANATLVLIDYQNEYLEGPITLPETEGAITAAARLLAHARRNSTQIIHVAHKGAAGGMFDRASKRGDFIAALAPLEGEIIVEKPRPNSFSGTTLAEHLRDKDRTLIVAGFMTHMCVSSTVRAALDEGLFSVVAADACATRDLPHPSGDGVIPARTLHDAALAALSDRFAHVVSVNQMI
ncbi:MAG: isochorismatase family protein [Beijerinckiaceae bacterium]